MKKKFEDSASDLFYHRIEYLEMISKETKYEYDKYSFENKIETNLFQTETSIGTHLTTSPYFGFNGIYSSGHSTQIEFSQACSDLSDFILKLYENSNIQSLSLYLPFCPPDDIEDCVSKLCGELGENPNFFIIERETDYIQLQSYILPPKRRYDLKRSMRSAIYTAPLEDTQLRELYEIYYTECLRREIPIKSFHFILDLLSIPNSADYQIYATAAFKDGKLVGGLVTVSGPQTVSYYLPIFDYKYASDHVGVRLISEHILHWKARGKDYFNFEASPRRNPNVRKFKQGFDAVSYKYQIVGFAKPKVKEQLAELIKTNPGFFFYPSPT